MTRAGGGWTFGVKHWYTSGMQNQGANAYGSVDDALTRRGNGYKLSDDVIKAIIGEGRKFDVLIDQQGSYSYGNNECARACHRSNL